eukprot:4919058-Pyramimonas_sp.AAC.2
MYTARTLIPSTGGLPLSAPPSSAPASLPAGGNTDVKLSQVRNPPPNAGVTRLRDGGVGEGVPLVRQQVVAHRLVRELVHHRRHQVERPVDHQQVAGRVRRDGGGLCLRGGA